MDASEPGLTPEDLIPPPAEVAALNGGSYPIGRERTGMPPGNPITIVGPEEPALRQREIAALGKEEAATRAWSRMNAARAAKGTTGASKPRSGAKTANPKDAGPIDLGAARQEALRSTTKGRSRQDVQKWANGVQFAHSLIAMRIGDPHWMISDEEAMLLTEGIVGVLDEYGIKLKGQVGAWGAFAYAASMVWGPRLAGSIVKQLRERQAAQQQQSGQPGAGPDLHGGNTADLSGLN